MRNYWYISESFDGWQNLAMDEWFLDHLSPEDMILYFYRNANAVIIGKNQNPWKECNLAAMDKDGVQLVRRITGGGAVYHDLGNLNFSFIVGEKRYDLEKQLCVILKAVESFGIPCAFSGRNDLLANGRKFSGNAFCGRGEIRQHHGTLLLHSDLDRLQEYLHVDPQKIQSKGIESVRARVCNLAELSPSVTVENMLGAIRTSYEAMYGETEDYCVTAEKAAEVKAYYDKQVSWDWKMGNTMPFDIELNHRFPWGGVQILISLQKAIIQGVQVYSDAMDAELVGEISERLTGCRFSSPDMYSTLAVSEKEQILDIAAYLQEQQL